MSQMLPRAPAAALTLRLFSSLLSGTSGKCIHLQMAELSHKSAAARCIDLVYGSFWSIGFYWDFQWF